MPFFVVGGKVWYAGKDVGKLMGLLVKNMK